MGGIAAGGARPPAAGGPRPPPTTGGPPTTGRPTAGAWLIRRSDVLPGGSLGLCDVTTTVQYEVSKTCLVLSEQEAAVGRWEESKQHPQQRLRICGCSTASFALADVGMNRKGGIQRP